ncbi:MAG: hypothetical protein KDB90_12780 [Planctomycetes bacterium]|nr:hypothetical protein [Planctomycetota bacterium]
MHIDPDKARKLCSEAEFELFTESIEPEIFAFTAEGLKKRAFQSQKLFQLWAERVGMEKDAGWGKVGDARKKAATGYITARQKAELFEMVWKAFDARLRLVMKKPNQALKDNVKYRKETGKIDKSTGRVIKPTNKVAKPGGSLLNRPTDQVEKPQGMHFRPTDKVAKPGQPSGDSFARPAGEPLNKPDETDQDPNRVWL